MSLLLVIYGSTFHVKASPVVTNVQSQEDVLTEEYIISSAQPVPVKETPGHRDTEKEDTSSVPWLLESSVDESSADEAIEEGKRAKRDTRHQNHRGRADVCQPCRGSGKCII